MRQVWAFGIKVKNGELFTSKPHIKELDDETYNNFRWDRPSILDFPESKQIVFLSASKEFVEGLEAGFYYGSHAVDFYEDYFTNLKNKYEVLSSHPSN